MNPNELIAQTHGFFFGERGLVDSPYDVTPEDTSLEQIARNLSRICRYVGNGRHFYSVAEHSVLISRLVPEEFAKDGLFHDATEIFTGDLHSLLKKLMFISGDTFYVDLETYLYRNVIAAKFGLNPELPDIVHTVDKQFQGQEVSSLFYGQEYKLCGLSPSRAEDLFLWRAYELGVS